MPSFTVFRGQQDGPVKKDTTTKPDLTGDQVYVRVTASGLCGTDVHYHHAGCALGHEGVGVVDSTGPDVKQLKKGDRVGWGYVADTCGLCQYCLSGREVFCLQRQMYGEANLDQGSFSDGAVWREAFLFKTPDNLTDEEAAPLQCGGATVFNVLRFYDIKPTERVGIIGVGGLGHLAIQFAAAMGCHTTVFSGTDSKKEEAMKLGAKSFYATKGKKEVDVGDNKITCLIVTTSAPIDWDLYIPLLERGAKIFPLTVTFDDFKFPQLPMIQSGITIQGSVVAPRWVHKEMLEFCARHDVKPMINKFPMTEQGIEDAIKTLNEGKMRYRGVLVNERNLKK